MVRTIRISNVNPDKIINKTMSVTSGKQVTKEITEKWIITQLSKPVTMIHSIFETIQIDIDLYKMEKSVVGQLVRATNYHQRHFVQSSRPDWTKKERDPSRLVEYFSQWSIKALLAMANQRLCKTCERSTRFEVVGIKAYMVGSPDKWLRAIGRSMSCGNCGACDK